MRVRYNDGVLAADLEEKMAQQAQMDYTYSVVVPVYNEEDVLPELYRRLTAVMRSIGGPYEIIFVNDSSKDRTLDIIKDLNSKDSSIKVLTFSRNFGHQVALTAGMDHARGKAVILMDGDLQHPPELIPKMAEKWREGGEVIFTIRDDRGQYSWVMRSFMASFYFLLSKISKLNLQYGQSDFRLLDRKVVDVLKGLREEGRFLRGLTEWVGFRRCEVHFPLENRFAGASKWSFLKHIEFALDGIIGFSKTPLRIAVFSGAVVALLGFFEALRVIYLKVFCGIQLTGWPELIIAVLLLGGIQLITIGILGEYLGRVFEQGKQRPLYIVADKIGFIDQ